MNIETVNELIASLESAGELSIKETKVMALARAYQQLSAENVGLKGALTGSAYISFIKANGWNTSASTVNGKFVNFADPEVDFGSMVFAHAKKLIEAVETPATDRIVAGIKADGVELFAAEQRGVAERLKKRGGDVVMSSIKFCLESAEEAEVFAQQLRDGGNGE
ncbi:hypothetical protein [Klebsiella michiganensis]|uniref:hypothetical protein n=1 Tax=Klebsiella michiganensis TaxID=1134687 RepID=UPI001911409C|nr:hypothetical protein [Klebsiella michiganensis]HBM2937003.1 hypothetical protein [Klebsiella michiganensis]HED3414261.1 hypothetical protein [Klebsiella michiganensis]